MPRNTSPKWKRILAPRRWTLLWQAGKALKLLVPMWRDCLLGRYRPLPWKALALSLLTIGYLLWPIDLVPDVIPLWGLSDDIVICSWLLSRLYNAMLPWRKWHEQQPK